jgi:hypothetical protein
MAVGERRGMLLGIDVGPLWIGEGLSLDLRGVTVPLCRGALGAYGRGAAVAAGARRRRGLWREGVGDDGVVGAAMARLAEAVGADAVRMVVVIRVLFIVDMVAGERGVGETMLVVVLVLVVRQALGSGRGRTRRGRKLGFFHCR